MEKTINEKLEEYKQNQRRMKDMEVTISRLVLAGAISIALMLGFIIGVVV